jgi:hypothetical protein
LPYLSKTLSGVLDGEGSLYWAHAQEEMLEKNWVEDRAEEAKTSHVFAAVWKMMAMNYAGGHLAALDPVPSFLKTGNNTRLPCLYDSAFHAPDPYHFLLHAVLALIPSYYVFSAFFRLYSVVDLLFWGL